MNFACFSKRSLTAFGILSAVNGLFRGALSVHTGPMGESIGAASPNYARDIADVVLMAAVSRGMPESRDYGPIALSNWR